MPLSDTAALSKDRNAPWCEFQHRHFATIADMLRRSKAGYDVVCNMADCLAKTNPRFDKSRFVDAVGVANPAEMVRTPGRRINLN